MGGTARRLFPPGRHLGPGLDARVGSQFPSLFGRLGPRGDAADGHVRWRLPLTGGPAWRSFDQSQYPEGCLAGHLLVMTMDDYVWAVHILAKKGRVLWSKGTVSKRRDRAEERLMMPQVPEMARQAKPLANPLPRLIAATSEYVCFEQDRRLLAVEPLSGSPLWTAKTWPRGVT